MNFISTFTKEIYEICGKNLLDSFLSTQSNTDHSLYIFFENEVDPYNEEVPTWLSKYKGKENIKLLNIMTYKFEGQRIVDKIDSELSPKIKYTDEYSSPRSVKWFRPVAAIQYASEIIKNKFCSLDSDCVFTKEVTEDFFDNILGDYNMAFLGREHFKTMRHGGYVDGKYVCTNICSATKKDTHTETGFLGFNLTQEGTKELILENFKYWVDGRVLSLEFKTDCHTLDESRKKMNLKYNNLCEPLGEISPIGSKVIEATVVGEFLTHEKGTIGPILYSRHSLSA
jgi:lipopolysaccharide biosynthesis glycosyltransferase